MPEEFDFAIVDAHGSHVFDPVATIEVTGVVTIDGQIERQVTMPKNKDVHSVVFRRGQPVQTVLEQVFLRCVSERLFTGLTTLT